MIKLYQELQQQENIALALNTAQCWLRDSTVQDFRAWLPHSRLNRIWRIKLDQYFHAIEAEKGVTEKPFESPYYCPAAKDMIINHILRHSPPSTPQTNPPNNQGST
jgi:CHAT domain-containing protein